MRLIDADEVKKAFIGNRYGTKAIEYVIDDAPTVEAIPKEWIKKWCNIEHKSCEERLMLRYGVITMLEDWEKENANNKTE